jgi:serine/threonine-protein kinase
MSPEQASGVRDLDARSDVYALGCMLYETLAGEPPYTGPTAQSVVAQHLAGPIPHVRQLRELVPDTVERAITRALAKLPADRFPSAHDFATALSTPVEVTPIQVTPSGAMPVRVTRVRLGTVIGAIAAVAALVLFVLNVGGIRDRLTGKAGTLASVSDGRRSVAVLPFQNVGGPDEEYFSDGLTDELIVALSHLRSLRVAARTSAFAFKGQARDVREIARALSVATVLVGSVRKTENRVRVTAQLIDASNGLDIWSETYEERNLADIFDIQADVALRIARALEANLSLSDSVRISRKPTENVEAYTLYLKGRYFWGRRGERLTTAIEYFVRAIAVDPQYARAYAGLAGVFGPMGIQGYIQPQAGRDSMRRPALKAVELDDSLAEAHTALGAYYHVYEWNWEAAEREYRRAIELDPNFPTAHLWYGFFLESMGRFDEAIAERKRARDLDPLAPSAYSGLGTALLLSGRVDSAKAVYREGIKLDPDYWQTHEGLGVLLETAGQLDEARESFQRAAAIAGRTQRPRADLARIDARTKRNREAAQLLDELRREATASGIYDPRVASALFVSGNHNGAYEWLEEAYRQRHPGLTLLKTDLAYQAMRRDTRFQEILRRVGLRS